MLIPKSGASFFGQQTLDDSLASVKAGWGLLASSYQLESLELPTDSHVSLPQKNLPLRNQRAFRKAYLFSTLIFLFASVLV